jgi:hypothetical protein
VADDVASLSMGAVKDAIRGAVLWRTVTWTVIPDALIPLSLWQRMRRWTTRTSNHRERLVKGG